MKSDRILAQDLSLYELALCCCLEDALSRAWLCVFS